MHRKYHKLVSIGSNRRTPLEDRLNVRRDSRFLMFSVFIQIITFHIN